ncbi:agamous-like MADS-box protein AGL61 [Capsicum galapagoense]
MENKQGKRRQKIPMKKIEKQVDLYSIFSKRFSGLYKKASELVRECGVDIGMVSFSHFFTLQLMQSFLVFSNPDMQLSESTQLVEAHALDRVKRFNSRLEEFDTMKDAEFFQKNVYDELMKTIEELNAEELTQLEGWLNMIGSDLQNRLNQLEKEAKLHPLV